VLKIDEDGKEKGGGTAAGVLSEIEPGETIEGQGKINGTKEQ